MKLAIMQPYFFPYIGYFQAIKSVDKYMLYENLDYITEGWMHRNRILVKYDKPVYIFISLSQKSSNKKIYDIKLDTNSNWRKRIINSIKYNYGGSKFFNDIFPIIEKIINAEYEYLYDYNINCIVSICDYLSIRTKILTHNEKYRELESELCLIDSNDYSLFPDLLLTKPDKKTARVLAICKNEKADVFINAIGGTNLYNTEEFAKYGIKLHFINTLHFEYKQFSKTFVPNLSIIDVLMHCGKEKTEELLENYKLI